ncbi:MAG: lipoyl synthase [Deltaproteobacteria bacterium]|nr:lipoyl synthase [Deltaproteobacteria bacterium]
MARLPEWLRKRSVKMGGLHRMKRVLRERGLNTVCESANCPNIGECFSKATVTFLILGNRCTRGCGFCNIDRDTTPGPVDGREAANIALTVKEMGLKHVVITSVTRDDLPDGGASHFALTIQAMRDSISPLFIEVLTPDFRGKVSALATLLDAGPDIFNHNVETVPSLYPEVRPQADYTTSLDILKRAKEWKVTTKSGIMVGLGEERGEVVGVMEDLRAVGCDAITIGQYLQPNREALAVREYVRPEIFREYEEIGRSMGFSHVYSAPFVRSSYNAEEQLSSFAK